MLIQNYVGVHEQNQHPLEYQAQIHAEAEGRAKLLCTPHSSSSAESVSSISHSSHTSPLEEQYAAHAVQDNFFFGTNYLTASYSPLRAPAHSVAQAVAHHEHGAPCSTSTGMAAALATMALPTLAPSMYHFHPATPTQQPPSSDLLAATDALAHYFRALTQASRAIQAARPAVPLYLLEGPPATLALASPQA